MFGFGLDISLFIISLAFLYFANKAFFAKSKILLLVLFITINAVLMLDISFADDRYLGFFYNAIFSMLLVLPNMMAIMLKKTSNKIS